MKTLILTCTRRSAFVSGYVDGLLTCAASPHFAGWMHADHESDIARGRSNLLTQALRTKFDSFLWVDDDIAFTQAQFDAICTIPADCVGGVYPKRQPTPTPPASNFQYELHTKTKTQAAHRGAIQTTPARSVRLARMRMDAFRATHGHWRRHPQKRGIHPLRLSHAHYQRPVAQMPPARLQTQTSANCQLTTANSTLMSYQPKPNTWTLFQNTKKNNEMQPDYTGSALLELPDGTTKEYRLSAWKRVSKTEVKFIGGFIKPKEDQEPKLLDDAPGAGDENPW